MSLSAEYPVETVCEVLDYPVSSFYYQRRQMEAAAAPDDSEVRQQMQDIAAAYPTYGYRRMTAQLRRQGALVNRKRVARLMDEMGLKVKVKRRRCRTTNSSHAFPRYPNRVAGLAVIAPDEVWVVDITYVRLHQEFVYPSASLRASSGGHHGRLQPCDSGLALGPDARPVAYPDCLAACLGAWADTAYPSLRPGCPVRSRGLRRHTEAG